VRRLTGRGRVLQMPEGDLEFWDDELFELVWLA
jgi:hypothetical protein